MKVAIVGAGFAGLAAAWHLSALEGYEVSLFDAHGVGGGASGIAAGLLHPYVGEEGKRSERATEALSEAKALIEAVAGHVGHALSCPGLVRHLEAEEVIERFVSHAQVYKDVTRLSENQFYIDSALTVDCPRYLKGLWQLLESRGVRLIKEHIHDLSALSNFERVIIAAGAGVATLFPPTTFPVSFVRGQVLLAKESASMPLPEVSSVGKGYIARFNQESLCVLGSTYEKTNLYAPADRAYTEQMLLPKIARFFPRVKELEIVGCNAAVRVIRRGHHFPILAKLDNRVWVITALGSRGLLYHALMGKLAAQEVHETG